MRILRFILPLLLVLGAYTSVRSESNNPFKSSCSEIVRSAFVMVEEQCQIVGRNKVCYGHSLLHAQAQPHVSDFKFDAEGDTASVADIQNLQLSGMDLAGQSWGIALMQLQGELATSSDANVTLLLFGDVEIENQTAIGGEVEVSAVSDRAVVVRAEPKTSAPEVMQLEPGTTVLANGQLSDGSWLRIALPDGSGYGWLYTPLVESTGDLTTLDIVEDAAASFGPMRAIKFRSGMRDAMCAEAADSGILVQTPEGMAQVSLLINGVNVELGSTVYFQANPGDEMVIRVVEGHASLTVDGETVEVPAGFESHVPVDDELKVSGPAQNVVVYHMSTVRSLPIRLLPREITIHEPGSDDSDAEADEEDAEDEDTDVEDADVEESESADTTTDSGDEEATQGGKPEKTKTPKPEQEKDTPVPPPTVAPTDPPPPTVAPTLPPPPTDPPPTDPPPPPPTDVPLPTDPPPTDPPPPPPTEEEKITICHKGNTITINVSSWPDHQGHGDTQGACPG